MKDYKVYLTHILEAIEKIEKYTRNISFPKFLKDSEKQDAVVRNLEIIGEAASKIPYKLRSQYPNIEWRDVIDMRNRLIHEYFGVDLEIVWDVIKRELPFLKRKLKKILEM